MKINHILVSLSFILISSCSNEVAEEREIPKTSKVEKLIEHSKEFEKKVYSYETPGGKIHVAVGFGIANSIMIEGEGGNIRFTPQTEPERDLYAYMEQQTDHVVVEHFVSGPGLENIYRFLTHAASTEPSLSTEIIATTALREEGICRDAVNLMIGILGAVMGDHVLTMGCWRGVVITGGIMPRLQPLIVSSPLERRFRSVGEMSHILRKVPVWLSTDPHAGLKGARAAFGNPYLAHRMVTG